MPAGTLLVACRCGSCCPTALLICVLALSLLRLQEVNGSTKWKTDVVIKQPWTKVEGWALPEMPPLITDILISLDDRQVMSC